MTRKDAVKMLKSILQEWDSCLIDSKAARKILTRIEKEIGMKPPNRKGICFCHDCDCPPNHTWEPTK